MNVSNILLIAKQVAEEVAKNIEAAQNDQASDVEKQHSLNIAKAKTETLRKFIEDAAAFDESEKKRQEKDFMELEVLRKIHYGEKK